MSNQSPNANSTPTNSTKLITYLTKTRLEKYKFLYVLLNIGLILLCFLPWVTASLIVSDLKLTPIAFFMFVFASADFIPTSVYLTTTAVAVLGCISVIYLLRSLYRFYTYGFEDGLHLTISHRALSYCIATAIFSFINAWFFNIMVIPESFGLFFNIALLNLPLYLYLLVAIVNKIILSHLATTYDTTYITTLIAPANQHNLAILSLLDSSTTL